MPTAVIYARYSSHGQTEQSIEGQLHDAYAWAERNDYRIIGEYIDRALTGTRDARPDFQRMIRDAERRQFEAVLVWKLDRFARNRYDSAIYKAKLKKFGVRVLSVMENITDSPEGIILEGLLESMAEYYSANLSENVRRGQRESIAKGWYLGGHPPYGYRVQDHRLVPDDQEAPVAREIFRRYASGETLARIAEDLNARGLRTRAGSPFRVSSFDSMVKNPAYIGRLRYGDQEIPCSDPLIDPETYDRALARRQRNRRAPAASKATDPYLLQGKIFCGICGAPMIGESGHGHGGVYQYYTCSNRKKSHTCKKRNEKKIPLETFVIDQTIRYILDPARAAQISAAVVIEYRKEFGQDRTQDLQRRIHKLDQDLEKLVDSLLALPESARPRIAARMEQLEAQKADLETDLAKLRIASRITLTEEQVQSWLSTFRRCDPSDPAHRQKIIDDFINSVYVYDDKIVIFYNLSSTPPETIPRPDQLLDSASPIGSDLTDHGLPTRLKSEPGLVFVHGLIGLVIGR